MAAPVRTLHFMVDDLPHLWVKCTLEAEVDNWEELEAE
jgi:hypothetical protein